MKRPGVVVAVVLVDTGLARVVPVVGGGATVVDVDRRDGDVDEVDELGDPHAATRTPVTTNPTTNRPLFCEDRSRCRTLWLRSMKAQHSENFDGATRWTLCGIDIRCCPPNRR